MKKSKMLFIELLLALLCMILPLNAMAATTTQHGLEVELITDRQSYDAGDTILATLKVKNSSCVDFDDVTLENLLPDGCVLSTDSETSLTSDVKAGETIVLETRYVVEGAIMLPGTGDNSAFAAWCVLFAATSVLIVVFKKKGAPRMIALLLCIAMVSSVFATPIAAAAGEQIVIQISEKVSCVGKNVEFSAEVRYVLSEGNYDKNEISYSDPDVAHIVHDAERSIYYVNNRLALTAVEGAPRSLIEKLIAEHGGRVIGVIAITDDYQVEFDQSMTYNQLQQLITQFAGSSLIESVMLDQLFPMSYDYTPNDNEWKNEEWSAQFPEGKNWGVEAIDAIGAWDYRSGMERVSVGIIDGLFDTRHEDLNFYKVWNNTDYSDSTLPYDQKAHGTHVAGTFTAMFNNNRGIAGMAPELLRYGFSMLDADTDSILLDPDKSLTNSTKFKYALALLITSDCRVINVSMGTSSYKQNDYKYLDTFLTKLRNKGFDFLIVQSAGNYKKSASDNGLFVGCVENRDRIIVVGSVGTNGSHKNGLFGIMGERIFDGYHFSGYSNSENPCEYCNNWGSNAGDRVDVVAPGEKIYSTVPENKYEDSNSELVSETWSGTSMAAPHVSGVAALCYSVNPNLTAEEIKKIIIDTASPSVIRVPGEEYRLVNACDAVNMAADYTTDSDYEEPGFGTIRGWIFNPEYKNLIMSDVSIVAYKTNTSNNEYEYASMTSSDENGGYILALDPGTYTLMFRRSGYLDHFVNNVKVFDNQVTNIEDVPMIESDTADKGTVIGQIRDAVTGDVLPDVQIIFYPDWNNTMIIPEIWQGRLATCTTDSDGRYEVEIQQGAFTAVMTKEGYEQGTMNVTCMINPDMQNGAIRPLVMPTPTPTATPTATPIVTATPTVTPAVTPLTLKSITADSSTINVGETICWTVTTTGGKPPVYCDYTILLGEETVKTGTVQAPNAIEYTPTQAGEYYLSVIVRDSESAVLPAQKSEVVTVVGKNETPAGYFTIEPTSDGFAKITSYIGADTNVVVPEVIDGYTIEAIGGNAFTENTSITSIVMPASLKKIEAEAFYGCTGLENVSLNNGLLRIESGAFGDCTSLKSILLPDSITELGSSIFLGANGLTSINYPLNLAASLDASHFSYPDSPFLSFTISHITVPEGVTAIPDQMFNNAYNLTSITLPDTLETIGCRAFEDCSNLTSISLPDGITRIAEYAFYGCTSLKSIYLPDTISELGTGIFFECNSLTNVNYPLNLVTKHKCRADSSDASPFVGASSINSIIVPEGVRVIPDNIFKQADNLTSIQLPSTLETIGGYAFQYCTNLTSLVLPEGLEEIGTGAFSGCTSLQSIHLPDSIEKLGYGLFSGCINFCSVNYPLGLTSVADPSPFYDAPALESITVPEGVVSIPNNTFASAQNLTNINLPNTLKTIGENAFSYCTGLTRMIIPNGAESIGYSAFHDCTNLVAVEIPATTYIGRYAFDGCPSLTIYGYSGSPAETYANYYGIPFSEMDMPEDN